MLFQTCTEKKNCYGCLFPPHNNKKVSLNFKVSIIQSNYLVKYVLVAVTYMKQNVLTVCNYKQLYCYTYVTNRDFYICVADFTQHNYKCKYTDKSCLK